MEALIFQTVFHWLKNTNVDHVKIEMYCVISYIYIYIYIHTHTHIHTVVMVVMIMQKYAGRIHSVIQMVVPNIMLM